MSAARDAVISSALARTDRTLRLARTHAESAEVMRDESMHLDTATMHLVGAQMIVEELKALRKQLRALNSATAS